jgi:hypothetical protein
MSAVAPPDLQPQTQDRRRASARRDALPRMSRLPIFKGRDVACQRRRRDEHRRRGKGSQELWIRPG